MARCNIESVREVNSNLISFPPITVSSQAKTRFEFIHRRQSLQEGDPQSTNPAPVDPEWSGHSIPWGQLARWRRFRWWGSLVSGLFVNPRTGFLSKQFKVFFSKWKLSPNVHYSKAFSRYKQQILWNKHLTVWFRFIYYS